MSNIYIQEPPTNGKVLLKTTAGDIDIELWSKETPKSCRNFVQLCMEGYYDGTIFHRMVKEFIVQGGDPNGDGTGGESIYGKPFKDEFHTRLRFVRRGLVAMANSGKDDNGSQFFFTLKATPELQNKNTIFGKVTGNTLYNMLRLEEGLVDHDDRPLYPHKIISAEILSNPFDDIIPRKLKTASEETTDIKPKEKVKKNFNLLSFGDEAEEDEIEMDIVNQEYRGQSKSSHDLTDDPELSSVPAVVFEDDASLPGANPEVLDSIRQKLMRASADKAQPPQVESSNVVEEEGAQSDEEMDKRKDIKRQIKELKRELRKKKKMEEEAEDNTEKEPEVEENEEEDNKVLHEYHATFAKYQANKVAIPVKGDTARESQTLQLLEKFRNSLKNAKKDEDKFPSSEDEEDNDSWMAHQMHVEDVLVVAKDANVPTAERYDISDPRNPMTQRRRKEKTDKKHK